MKLQYVKIEWELIFCSLLGQFIYLKANNINIYYPNTFNYKSVFFKVFKKFMNINNGSNNIKKIKNYGIRGNQMQAIIETKQDMVSYFRENYLDMFNNELNKYFQNYKLPWDNNKNIICIHIRLDDVTNRSDYDGTGSANYINNLINTENYQNYNRGIMMKCSPDTQAPINPKKLKNLLIKLRNHYPEKEIHIIKYGKLNNDYVKLINEYNIKVHQNKPDYDL